MVKYKGKNRKKEKRKKKKKTENFFFFFINIEKLLSTLMPFESVRKISLRGFSCSAQDNGNPHFISTVLKLDSKKMYKKEGEGRGEQSL